MKISKTTINMAESRGLFIDIEDRFVYFGTEDEQIFIKMKREENGLFNPISLQDDLVEDFPHWIQSDTHFRFIIKNIKATYAS